MSKCTTRAEAGAAYQAAAQAYFDAWIELAAHDHAANASATGGVFSHEPLIAPHGEFMREPPANVHALVHVRHGEIAAAE